MRLAILGYGNQGRSAYDYWSAQGHEITICDANENVDLPDGASARLGAGHLKGLDEFDLIIRSPIVHPEKIIEANSKAILSKVSSVTNEFFKVCPTKNIIGVTGTKGKGTTSTLITKMLEAAGHKVHLGGNIGTPPLDLLKDNITKDDWVVLELANFQLIDLRTSPKIAVCLMVVPEHLDWHPTLDEYFESKKQLFAHQKATDTAIYYAKNEFSRDIASVSKGFKVPYYLPPGAYVENDDIIIDGQSICSTDEIKLLGQHNRQNICAAITAVWQVNQDIDAIRSILNDFSGLEHRLALISEIDGVKYYDDSFGTTPETAIVAIEAFQQPKIVILGGSDKGASYSGLAETVKNSNVKQAILIGDTAAKIKKELEAVGFYNFEQGGATMKEIVEKAQSHAQNGDVVLLSTGSASFGLFENYKDRAHQFIKQVRALA